ncbi:GAF domain-containing protein [Streptomyces sp. NPDC004050]
MARAFVSLTDTLAPDFDHLGLFDGLIGHCVDLLDADAGGVMMGDARGGLRIMAASGEEAVLLELLQLRTGSGPCVDCYHSGQPLPVPDLAAERRRWPELSAAALEVGYQSSQTVPLRLHDHVNGALTLFRRATGTLRPEEIELAQALADSAALSLPHWSADPVPAAEVLTKTQAAIAYKNALDRQGHGRRARPGACKRPRSCCATTRCATRCPSRTPCTGSWRASSTSTGSPPYRSREPAAVNPQP